MIRLFEESDENDCITIVNDCFNESIKLPADAKNFVHKRFTTRGYLLSKSKKYPLFVYLENDKIQGMGALDNNEIKKLYVNPKLHGKGVGSLILKHLEDLAKKKGYDEVVLYAYENSRGFYEKKGYKITNTYDYCGSENIKIPTIEMKKNI